MKSFVSVLVLVIIIAAAALLWMYRSAPWLAPYLGTNGAPSATSTQQQLVGKANYSCDMGKTIAAQFYQGSSTQPQAGQPPQPNGSVALSLSDGRNLTLPQTLSGSGIRYANADESIIFWSKGNSAFIEEQGTTTFMGCISPQSVAGQESWGTYASTTMGIAFKYPPGYTPSAFINSGFGPGKGIPGVKATIPSSEAQGTNLSSDSYVSVEQLPKATSCTADQFIELGAKGKARDITADGMSYSFASTTGAGAGNRYEEWVWAIPNSSPCTAVHYFIHYGVLENYPAGTVTAFDEQKLLGEFDGVRRSFVIGQ